MNTLVNDADLLPKVAEVLDLIFKKKKTGVAFQDGYNFSISQLKKANVFGKNLVSVINECLLNHRFKEATKLLWYMCQDRCAFDLVLYKGIMVALDNLISSDEVEIIRTVTRDIRNLRTVNKLELQLEYLIYALRQDINGPEDSYYLEGKTRKRKFKRIPCIDLLYSAYSALINYIVWANVSQDEKLSETVKECASTIIHTFKQLVYNPGIWDIFIIKLIEILECYEQYDELEEILKKYVELNPSHFNAYVYLCVHLHKHDGDEETFINYAKILSNLCPSDERVLLLVQKWDELGKNLKKCLKILFAFLDYPVNGHRQLGWKLLSVHLHKAISSKESSLMELIDLSWKKRSSSWTYMHFKLTNINTDALEIIQWKVKVLFIIQPNHNYLKKIKKKFPAIKDYLLQNGESSLTSKDFELLYSLNENSICR